MDKRTIEDVEDFFRFGERIIDNPRLAHSLPSQIYVPSGVHINRIISPKRLELLSMISRRPNANVNWLAHKLHRKKEAISRDLAILRKHNLITTEQRGREKAVATQVKYVLVPVSN